MIYLYVRINDQTLFNQIAKQPSLSDLRFHHGNLCVGTRLVDKRAYDVSWGEDIHNAGSGGTEPSGNGVLFHCKLCSVRGGLWQRVLQAFSDLGISESANVSFGISNLNSDQDNNLRATRRNYISSRAAKHCLARALADEGNTAMLAAYFDTFVQEAQKKGEVAYSYDVPGSSASVAGLARWELDYRFVQVLMYDHIVYKVFDTADKYLVNRLSPDTASFVNYVGYNIREACRGLAVEEVKMQR